MILTLLGEYYNFLLWVIRVRLLGSYQFGIELGSKIKFIIFNFLFCFCFCNCSNFILFSFQDYNIDNYFLPQITPYRFKISLVCIHQNS